MRNIHTDGRFVVNLITGGITFVIENIAGVAPIKICDSLVLADYHSINILIQNREEAKFKGNTYPQCNRLVLDAVQIFDCNELENYMKSLKTKYPEHFI